MFEHKENEKELNGGKSLKELSLCVAQILNSIFHYDHGRIEKTAHTPAPRGEIRGEPALVRKGPRKTRIFPTINSLKEEKI
jgi:hypothetical protein